MSKQILIINPASATSILAAAMLHQFAYGGVDCEVSFKNRKAPSGDDVLDMWKQFNPDHGHNPPLLMQDICNGLKSAQFGLVAMRGEFFEDGKAPKVSKYPFLYEKSSEFQNREFAGRVIATGKHVMAYSDAMDIFSEEEYPEQDPPKIDEGEKISDPAAPTEPNPKADPLAVKPDAITEENPKPLENVHTETAKPHIDGTKEIAKENTHDNAEVNDQPAKEEPKSKELKDFIGGPENATPEWKEGDPLPGEHIDPNMI